MTKITFLSIGVAFGLTVGVLVRQVLAVGSINACVSRIGFVRIVDTDEKCRRNETAINFAGSSVAASGGFISDLSGINLDAQNFNFHNLTGTNFSNSNLRNTHFRYSILTGSNFLNTDLTSSNLDHAVFQNIQNADSIKWYACPGDGCTATICPDGTVLQTNGGTCVGHLAF